MDIISCTGGKTAGIKAYLKENKISVNDTVAFGDGENDIDMLEFCCKKTGETKAEIIRQGIKTVYENLKKE